MRIRMRGLWVVLVLGLTGPVSATLDDGGQDAAYRGFCQMTQTCTSDDLCGATPVLGDLLVVVEDGRTWMGRDEASLEPIDRYGSLADALPLPRTDTRRRTFLTDLPPEGTARRFAVRIQTLRAETGDPILRGQYFVLRCQGL